LKLLIKANDLLFLAKRNLYFIFSASPVQKTFPRHCILEIQCFGLFSSISNELQVMSNLARHCKTKQSIKFCVIAASSFLAYNAKY